MSDKINLAQLRRVTGIKPANYAPKEKSLIDQLTLEELDLAYFITSCITL